MLKIKLKAMLMFKFSSEEIVGVVLVPKIHVQMDAITSQSQSRSQREES
jgi:hypothetical protein